MHSEDESPGGCRSEVGCSAGCALKPVSWPSTALITDTSAGSTRVGLTVTEDEIPSFFHDKTSDLAIYNPHYRQQSRVCKGGTDITALKKSEEHISSFC